jgi:hypothetical protein
MPLWPLIPFLWNHRQRSPKTRGLNAPTFLNMIITEADLKGFTGNLNNDDLNSSYILAAQSIIEDFIGYKIEEVEYTEKISGVDINIIDLGIKPISAVDFLSIDGEIFIDGGLTDETYIIKDNFLIFPDRSGFLGEYNISVTFTAGYAALDIPELFKVTCLRIAGILKSESNGNVGVKSKSFEDGSRTFSEIGFDKYLKVLNPYKVKI